ncbi:ATP-binding protein [Dehalobacter sp. DCM]|uniref:ATP-binding protein n=1 Tax=Dehalobacter sp. DCM TaxID=2907827 RepID=UPI003082179A|nr:ATP-binding protein [Dehalobacter sp. DCM]
MWNFVNKRQTYYIVSAAFLLISIVYIFLWKNQPYIGLWVENVNGQWNVTNSDPNGEAYRSGIKTGDIIIRINHDAVDNYSNIRKWNEAEGASSIEFRKAGQSKIQTIDILPKNTVLTLFTQFPLIMLGYLFGIIGFITRFKRPFLVQARALFRLNLCIGLAIVLMPASTCLILFAREAEYIVISLVPLLLIDFFSVMPKEIKSTIIRCIKIFFVFSFVTITLLTGLQSLGIIYIVSVLRKFILSAISLAIIFVIFTLISRIHSKDMQIRNQTIVLLGGTVLGLFPFVLMKVIPTVFDTTLPVYRDMSYLFFAFIPFSWHYIIINKFLPDSKVLFRKMLSLSVTAFISSLVLFFTAIFFNLLKSIDLNAYLQVLSLTILIIVCSLCVFFLTDQIMAKYITKKPNQSLTEKVNQLTSNLALFDESIPYKHMMHIYKIDGIFLIAQNHKNEYLKRTFGDFSEDAAIHDNLLSYFETNKPMPGGALGDQEAVRILEDIPATLYIPHGFDNFICGIFITCQDSDRMLEQPELLAVTTLAKELAQIYLIFYTMNQLSHDIKEIDRKSQLELKRSQGFVIGSSSVYKNIEKERKLIAEEIHGGPLQLGLDLSRWLKVLAQQGNAPKDHMAAKVITHLEELIDELNDELRQTCNNLRPATLSQLGLMSTLELLFKDIMFKESLLISFNYESFDRDDRFPEDAEIAAYRFIQEAITNVLKHAGVNTLQIHLVKTGSQLTITVEDCGRGFDTDQLELWSISGVHLGLMGIKERIESMGGVLQINSLIGKGTVLKAVLPVD